jgi:hypothetical protein
MGRYLAERDDDSVVYLHAPPFMYWDFGTLRFFTRNREGINVPPVGEGDPIQPEPGRGILFAFLPERLAELDDVRTRYPNGQETRVHSSADGRLLYTLYEIDEP